MKRIFKLIEKYFFIIILLAVAISLVYPNSFKWVLSEYNGINVLNLLLSLVLFTMGTTLKVDDFLRVFKHPKEISVGLIAQYMVMPVLAFSLAEMFSLDAGLTVGLILVGTVPGGTASDVITFLANGDVALSVSLTAFSTVISPILTPIITLFLIGNQIHFNPVDMFVSIVEIVIIPIVLGLILNYKFPDFCEKLKDYLPAISSIVICLIVAGVIGANKQAILTSSAIILIVIVLQYFLAMLVGFGLELWRYGSPIAYGLQLVPDKYLGLYLLNPVTPILSTFRYAVFGFGYFDISYYVISWIISILVFLIGLIMFSRIERTFMDTI